MCFGALSYLTCDMTDYFDCMLDVYACDGDTLTTDTDIMQTCGEIMSEYYTSC